MVEHLLKKRWQQNAAKNQVIIKVSKTVKLDNNRDLAIKCVTCFVVWVFDRFFLTNKIACDCSIECESPDLPRSNQDQHCLDQYSCKIRFPKKKYNKAIKEMSEGSKIISLSHKWKMNSIYFTLQSNSNVSWCICVHMHHHYLLYSYWFFLPWASTPEPQCTSITDVNGERSFSALLTNYSFKVQALLSPTEMKYTLDLWEINLIFSNWKEQAMKPKQFSCCCI